MTVRIGQRRAVRRRTTCRGGSPRVGVLGAWRWRCSSRDSPRPNPRPVPRGDHSRVRGVRRELAGDAPAGSASTSSAGCCPRCASPTPGSSTSRRGARTTTCASRFLAICLAVARQIRRPASGARYRGPRQRTLGRARRCRRRGEAGRVRGVGRHRRARRRALVALLPRNTPERYVATRSRSRSRDRRDRRPRLDRRPGAGAAGSSACRRCSPTPPCRSWSSSAGLLLVLLLYFPGGLVEVGLPCATRSRTGARRSRPCRSAARR